MLRLPTLGSLRKDLMTAELIITASGLLRPKRIAGDLCASSICWLTISPPHHLLPPPVIIYEGHWSQTSKCSDWEGHCSWPDIYDGLKTRPGAS